MKLAAQPAYEAGASVYERERRDGASPAVAMALACKMVRQTLRDCGALFTDAVERRAPKWTADVIAKVAAAHEIHPACILGRERIYQYARSEAAWTLRQCKIPGFDKLPWSVVGAAMNRDHSTCISAVRDFEARMAQNDLLRARVTKVVTSEVAA